MSFSCVSASILDTDGHDNFHTVTTLKTECVENAMAICVSACANCL